MPSKKIRIFLACWIISDDGPGLFAARTEKKLYAQLWEAIEDHYEEMTGYEPDMTVPDKHRVHLYFKACEDNEENEYLTLETDNI